MCARPVTPSEVTSAGIDWLTATFKPGPKAELAEVFAARWTKARNAQGYQSRDWHWEGYAGQATDGISYGSRYDGLLVRLSSDLAAERASSLLAYSDNVSRVDVQLTTRDATPGFDWAELVSATARKDKRCEAGITKVSEIQAYPGGHTTYIGRRGSDRFFRCYDKHSESEGLYLPGSWRWEIEYKGSRAAVVAARLANSPNVPDTSRGIVEQAFLDYGVVVPTVPLPRGWRDTSPRGPTSDERRLAWLQRSVGPMVKRMLESNDAPTILEALGLGAYSPVELETTEEGGEPSCSPDPAGTGTSAPTSWPPSSPPLPPLAPSSQLSIEERINRLLEGSR